MAEELSMVSTSVGANASANAGANAGANASVDTDVSKNLMEMVLRFSLDQIARAEERNGSIIAQLASHVTEVTSKLTSTIDTVRSDVRAIDAGLTTLRMELSEMKTSAQNPMYMRVNSSACSAELKNLLWFICHYCTNTQRGLNALFFQAPGCCCLSLRMVSLIGRGLQQCSTTAEYTPS